MPRRLSTLSPPFWALTDKAKVQSRGKIKMQHHKDIEKLLHDSPIRRNRRRAVYAIILLGIVIVGINMYISSQAQSYKEKAMEQVREERIAQNVSNEKTIAYFNQIKVLTANYHK